MPNGALEKKLREAYLPYVRGFLTKPREARLKISIDKNAVIAVLWLAKVDKPGFDQIQSEQRRAFNNLARANIRNAEPILAFEFN